MYLGTSMDPLEKNTVPKVSFVLSYASRPKSIWRHKIDITPVLY